MNIIENVYSIMKDIRRIPSTIRETKHSTEIPVHMVNGKMVQFSGFFVSKAHKLPALMQAIAILPVLEPWTGQSQILVLVRSTNSIGAKCS